MNNYWLDKAESMDSTESFFTVIRYDDEDSSQDAIVDELLKPNRWDYLCLVCGVGEGRFQSPTAAAQWVEAFQQEFRQRACADPAEDRPVLPSIVVLAGKTEIDSKDSENLAAQERLEELGAALHEIPATCAEASAECVAGEFFKQMAADSERDRAHLTCPGDESEEPSSPGSFSTEHLGEPLPTARRYSIPPVGLLAAGGAPMQKSLDEIKEQAEGRASALFEWYKKDENTRDDQQDVPSTDDEP